MKTLLKILETLEPRGIGVKQDISDILDEAYPITAKLQEYEFNALSGAISRFLEEIYNTKEIDFDRALIGSTAGFRNKPTKLYDTGFNATITQKGILLLREEQDRASQEKVNQSSLQVNDSTIRLNDSISATNESIRQTNSLMVANASSQSSIMTAQTDILREQGHTIKRQNNLYIVLLVLTGLSLFVSVAACIIDINSNADKQEIATLHTQLSNLTKELKELQTPKSVTVQTEPHFQKLKSKKK